MRDALTVSTSDFAHKPPCTKCGREMRYTAMEISAGPANEEYDDFIAMFGEEPLRLCLVCVAEAMGFKPKEQD